VTCVFQTADGFQPLFISGADGSPENVVSRLGHADTTLENQEEDTLIDVLSVKRFL